MRNSVALLFSILVVLGLSACSTIDELTDTEESTIAAATPEIEKSPVVRIESLELGRLYRGYMLIATGVAPGTGYYLPELRIRYGGELGPDGFYEFDFVAAAPDDPSAGSSAPVTARILRGDYELTPLMLRSARGVRVWSSRDSVEGRF